MNKPKLIIDTDPGHDDALAILMTIMSDQFDVMAITTVAGNSTITNVTRNAQAILNVIGSKIPLYSGDAQPLARQLVTAVVHGKSGLAGFDTSATTVSLTGDAPQQLVEIVKRFPGEVTILALGPLSNVARAVQLDGNFATTVKQIVMMGGAINVPGNKNRVAEFNFFVDPEAADLVFRSSLSKVLIPLDVCNQVTLSVDQFRKLKNATLRLVLLPMMEHFAAGLKNDEGTAELLVYDALAAYFLLNPSASLVKAMDILIETTGQHTAGMCVTEKRIYKDQLPNVDVVIDINAQTFRRDFFEILDSGV